MYSEDACQRRRNAVRQMVEKAKTLPQFLAYSLEQFQQQEDVADETLAGMLQCLMADLDALRLCRAPKNLDEVQMIADRISCDPKILAEILGIES